ncbi:MAG: biotin/lipoyl-binding protein [Zetaproteobacteria bacterium]|nr:MAG: biotin/lipoyl-binding protein [Zetaproteobacteria bacterium]
MKSYRVTVDGQSYEVTVEEVKGAGPAPARPASPPAPAASVAAPTAAPARPPASVTTVRGGDRTVPAPMPGKILAVKVVAGDTVARGDVLMILEAMKMENDILAPMEGAVKSVHVQAGDTVNTGDVLLVMQ